MTPTMSLKHKTAIGCLVDGKAGTFELEGSTYILSFKFLHTLIADNLQSCHTPKRRKTLWNHLLDIANIRNISTNFCRGEGFHPIAFANILIKVLDTTKVRFTTSPNILHILSVPAGTIMENRENDLVFVG